MPLGGGGFDEADADAHGDGGALDALADTAATLALLLEGTAPGGALAEPDGFALGV
jgi:hypothetical protein